MQGWVGAGEEEEEEEETGTKITTRKPLLAATRTCQHGLALLLLHEDSDMVQAASSPVAAVPAAAVTAAAQFPLT